ncbi:MAG: serine/threonine protein kinase, partial [Planctomycetota bacterium]
MNDHPHALPQGYELYEYRIRGVLGHGAMGITYRAWDTNLDKEVAIKEYLPGDLAERIEGADVGPRSSSDRDAYLRGLDGFLKEAQTLALFRHPSIVTVHRFFEANGTGYMVMEYEKGESLSALLRRRKEPFTEDALKRILLPLLDGLAVVHGAAFIHGDIKPANVRIREDGTPVLLDFGSVRTGFGDSNARGPGAVTPGYAPIEQYYADGNVGPWTDIYALAAIMYEAVSGRPPP